MSQQPPEWWARQRGPRFGCADVTIVSIASIIAFVILIFVLLRPDFARVVDITSGGGAATVAAIRATETPAPPSSTRGALPAVTSAPPTATPVPATPTPSPIPTPAIRSANLLDDCRLRQDPSTNALVIQVFQKGKPFKVYPETRNAEGKMWVRVEPDDGTNRVGWMWLNECFGNQ